MAKPFSQMSFVMNRRAREISQNVDRIVKKVASTIDRGVILDTRVDTGEARSNWVVTIDRSFNARIPPYAPGMRLGKGETANASAAISQGSSAIGRFNSRRNRAIFISNNAPHIGILNDKDGQFVQMNIMRAGASVRGRKLLR